MFCQNCGTELPDGAGFCMKCGSLTGVNRNQVHPQGTKGRQEKGNTKMHYIILLIAILLFAGGFALFFAFRKKTDKTQEAFEEPEDSKDWSYALIDNELSITGYTGESNRVVIPTRVDGKPVTRIGEKAFCGRNDLIDIVIPSGITTIEDFAFSECNGLTRISIPDSVTSIGLDPFPHHDDFMQIDVSIDNKVYASFDGCLYNKEMTEFICCPKGKTSVMFSTGLTTIGFGAFSDRNITSVELPEGLTTIEKDAFWASDNLTSVKFPTSLTSIGYQAFSGCDGLTSVYLPDGLKTIEAQAFSNCDNLTRIRVPDSVSSIKDYVFSNCSADLVIYCNEGSLAYEYVTSYAINKDGSTFICGVVLKTRPISEFY